MPDFLSTPFRAVFYWAAATNAAEHLFLYFYFFLWVEKKLGNVESDVVVDVRPFSHSLAAPTASRGDLSSGGILPSGLKLTSLAHNLLEPQYIDKDPMIP